MGNAMKPPQTFSFSTPEGARAAARLFKRQLESVGKTKVNAEARGTQVSVSIRAPSPIGQKAAEYTARRLAKILAGLDAANA